MRCNCCFYLMWASLLLCFWCGCRNCRATKFSTGKYLYKSRTTIICTSDIVINSLQLFPAIKILENWTFSPHSSGKHNPKVKWLKNYFRAAIVCFSALIAWAGANDLDKFVSLVGSFACIPLIYIYPPMLHFKAFKKDKSKLFMASDIFLLFFGIIVMIYTSLQTIGMWLN